MFRIKTPHRRPLRHMFNMLGLFTFAAIATIGLHLGAAINAGPSGIPFLALAASALTAGAISLVVGIIVTATVRRALNLVQTGRLIQYSGFCLAGWLGLNLSAYFFSAITLTAPFVAGFFLFAIAFGLATALGEVPWRGRTWLPMAAKKSAAKPVEKPTESGDQNSNKKS
jgi:hypothetical protein